MSNQKMKLETCIELWPILKTPGNDFKLNIVKSFHIFNDSFGENVLFVTLNDEVYGFGSNDYGVCGVGHEMGLEEVENIPELTDKKIEEFFNGANFVLAKTADNKLYGWGDNRAGQLGEVDYSDNKVLRPRLIHLEFEEKIEQVSCGLSFSLVLTSTGKIYGLGDNHFGQIGFESNYNEDRITKMTKINLEINENEFKAKFIYSCLNTSFAIVNDGVVLCWGENNSYMLGTDNYLGERVYQPVINDHLRNITRICSSKKCTYFLDKNGNIYFSGIYKTSRGTYFQKRPTTLDPRTFFQWIFSPKLIFLSFESIIHFNKEIGTFENISIAIANNDIYTLEEKNIIKTAYTSNCFKEYFAKLFKISSGIVETDCIYFRENSSLAMSMSQSRLLTRQMENYEEELFKDFPIIKSDIQSICLLKIFDDSKGYNIIFVTINDEVYSYGSNCNGLCGHGHSFRIKLPAKIDQLKHQLVTQFYNGLDFALAYTSENDIYGWGKSDKGQLGFLKKNY